MRRELWVLSILVILVNRTPAGDPPTAESLASRILDSEALYTVTGGLKPVSDGFWQTQFPAHLATSPEVEEARRILKQLPLGPDLEAGVFLFANVFDERKWASAFVAHKPRLRELIVRRSDVFEPLGITADSTPQQVMERIDRGPRSSRWRAFGLVFGYPEYAVEFFVRAGEEQDRTKKFVERDFVHLPTFASNEGRFVYAVPKGHLERAEDRMLRVATSEILTRYRAWRSVYLDDHKLGVVELLRQWIALSVVPPPWVGCPPIRIDCDAAPQCERRRLVRRACR